MPKFSCLFNQQQAEEALQHLRPMEQGADLQPSLEMMREYSNAIAHDEKGVKAVEAGYERKGRGRARQDDALIMPYALHEGDYSVNQENRYKTVGFYLDGDKPKRFGYDQFANNNGLLFMEGGPVYYGDDGTETLKQYIDTAEADLDKAVGAHGLTRHDYSMASAALKKLGAGEADKFDATAKIFREKNWVMIGTEYHFGTYTNPKSGQKFANYAYCASGHVADAGTWAKGFNWDYTYVFPYNKKEIKQNRAHPFSYQNLGTDAVVAYFINPLRNKESSETRLDTSERFALRAYWEYNLILYSGSGERIAPTAITGANAPVPEGASLNLGTDHPHLYHTGSARAAAEEKRGKKYEPGGLFNLLRTQAKYDKVVRIMRKFTIEKRVVYMYFVVWSLVKLVKMVVQAKLDSQLERKQNKAWRRFVKSKMELVRQYLDDKRNWPTAEVKHANKRKKGAKLMAVWLDMYGALKFIDEALATEREQPADVEFIAQAPPEQILQTLNENRDEYQEWLRTSGADTAGPTSMWQLCNTRGYLAVFYEYDPKTQAKTPITNPTSTGPDGKAVYSPKVEELARRNRLHVECEGLLASFADDIKGGAAAAVLPRPSYLSDDEVAMLLDTGLTAGKVISFDGNKLVDLPTGLFRDQIRKQALEDGDSELYQIMDPEDGFGDYDSSDDDDDDHDHDKKGYKKSRDRLLKSKNMYDKMSVFAKGKKSKADTAALTAAAAAEDEFQESDDEDEKYREYLKKTTKNAAYAPSWRNARKADIPRRRRAAEESSRFKKKMVLSGREYGF